MDRVRLLRIGFLGGNLVIVIAALEQRSWGAPVRVSAEPEMLAQLYSSLGSSPLIFAAAAVGLAISVAELVQRLTASRPMFGPDGRIAAMIVQGVAPAPFVVLFAFQLVMFALAIAALLFVLYALLQIFSG